MTYKHTDLQHSLIGRSLIKLATEKGMIIPEKTNNFTTVAEASKKVEALKPTDDFSSNLLKLCSGLRAQGFDKYASEIEVKFLQFKQANALYDVSKETGEDVVNQAHPEGSHDLKGVEGDATIETILERSKKIQKAILKEPTGKLAAKDALNVARVILAQTKIDVGAIKTAVDKIVSGDVMGALDQALAIASHKLGFDPNVSDIFNHPLTTLWQHKTTLIPLVGPALQLFQRQNTTLKDAKAKLQADLDDFDGEVNIDNLNDIVARIDSIISIINSMDIDAAALDVKKTIIGDLNGGKTKLEEAKKLFSPSTQSTAPTQSHQTPTASADPVQKWTALVQKLNASTKINDEGKKKAIDWLNTQRQDLNDPQKAAVASKAIDDMEKHLIEKNLI